MTFDAHVAGNVMTRQAAELALPQGEPGGYSDPAGCFGADLQGVEVNRLPVIVAVEAQLAEIPIIFKALGLFADFPGFVTLKAVLGGKMDICFPGSLVVFLRCAICFSRLLLRAFSVETEKNASNATTAPRPPRP